MPKKLKAAERDELVDNLVTNCDCWQHEGSEAILNQMPDQQLIALNRSWLERQQLTANAEDDEEDESEEGGRGGLPENFSQPKKGGKLPEGGPNSGVTSSGADIASGRQEEDYPEDDISGDRDEADYEADRQEGGSNMKRSVTNMSAEEWLQAAQAPPAIVSAVRNAMAVDTQLKRRLIKTIIANAANPYSREQLMTLSTDQLKPLAQLASGGRPTHNGNGGRIASFWHGAQGAPVVNSNGSSGEEDVSGPPTLNWQAKSNEDPIIR